MVRIELNRFGALSIFAYAVFRCVEHICSPRTLASATFTASEADARALPTFLSAKTLFVLFKRVRIFDNGRYVQLQLVCGKIVISVIRPFTAHPQNSMDCVLIVLVTATTNASQTIAPASDGARKITRGCNLVCGNFVAVSPAAGMRIFADANQRPLTMCARTAAFIRCFQFKCAVHCLHCATLATINIAYTHAVCLLSIWSNQ